MRRLRRRENGMAHDILLPVKSRTAACCVYAVKTLILTSCLGRQFNTYFFCVKKGKKIHFFKTYNYVKRIFKFLFVPDLSLD